MQLQEDFIFQKIAGTTDSEHAFALFLSILYRRFVSPLNGDLSSFDASPYHIKASLLDTIACLVQLAKAADAVCMRRVWLVWFSLVCLFGLFYLSLFPFTSFDLSPFACVLITDFFCVVMYVCVMYVMGGGADRSGLVQFRSDRRPNSRGDALSQSPVTGPALSVPGVWHGSGAKVVL